MSKHFFLVLSVLCASIFVSMSAHAQQLGNLSPQQIQQKAAEAGYSVDTTQIRQYEAAQKGSAAVSKTAVAQPPVAVTPPSPAPASGYTVPEFANRGAAGTLPAFGYNVFTYSPTTFQPLLNVPTPTNYVIGPGDEIIISLWGETQLVQDLVVSKNGDIYIPNVGLVSVNGLTMSQLRDKLYDRLSKVYSSLLPGSRGGASTHLNISTGQLRSVKIYVLGEVAKPGGYTLPALSSAFTALYYSGGPTINGTLRNVEVVRDGKVVARIDLYDYLIKGDQSEDIRLNDGDIVFVPPVGKRVAVIGNVFRPAIYELMKGEKLGNLLQFASGLTFNAYFQTVHIDRVIPFSKRSDYRNNILSIDLSFKSVDSLAESNYAMDDGDVVTIDSINKIPQNKVTITGDVKQPGVYELTSPGMTVRDLVYKADSLFPDAFLAKAMLIRTLPSEKKEVIAFDLGKAMSGDPNDNLTLENRDEIHVYKFTDFHPTRTVEIAGQVRRPGTYPRLDSMTVADLIIMAGGITDSATTKEIEVTRLDTSTYDAYAQKFIINLPTHYWDVDPSKDFRLEDYDRVLVKPDSSKEFDGFASVTGEVGFPGTYTILHRGEKLTDLVRRAGGFRSSAYTEGIYLIRKNPILNDLQPVAISDTAIMRIYQGQPLINRTRFNAEFGQRIPIIWSNIVRNPSSIYNMDLRPGDVLVVPSNPGTITVAGDVGLPSTVPYKPGESANYYIRQAGGYTITSAKGDEVVVLPNGKKWESSGWFFIPNPEILAGSVIYVPSEIKQPSADIWPFIRDIITVVSSTAVLILTIKRL